MLNLIRLKHTPILEQLQIEEALMRTSTGHFCLINEKAPPAIIMGISGKPEELIEGRPACPVIRRYSGGGCVATDENTLFITFIGSKQLIGQPPTPSSIHCWVEKIYQKAFKELPFSLRENDYCLGDKKFGGNAQHIAKERFVHHSTLLWSYDPSHMKSLKLPLKKPNYRKERAHDEFLTTLAPHFSSQESLIQTFLSAFNTAPFPLEEALASLSLPHRKATLHIF